MTYSSLGPLRTYIGNIRGSVEENPEGWPQTEERKVCFYGSFCGVSWVQNRCTRVAPNARQSESSNGCTSANNITDLVLFRTVKLLWQVPA